MNLLLVSSSLRVVEGVSRAVGGSFTELSWQEASSGDALARTMTGPNPARLVIIEVPSDASRAFGLAEWAIDRHGAAVILVAEDPAAVSLPALRLGVRDVITPGSSPADYAAAIDRAARTIQSASDEPTASRRRGQVVTVASPKGGVGKTTVATNLAVGLSKVAPEATVLVDLDLHFGDVASALNLNPEYTLPDVARAARSGDALAVKSFLTRHETGLFVIPGSESPAAADGLSAKDVSNLLALLADAFTYVIVDTSPGLSEHTLAAMDLSNELVLVTSLDVPGVRGLRKEIDTLTELGLLLDARHIVLNFSEKARGLSVEDVEATINAKVDVSIPPTSLVPISVNQGIPLLQSNGKDPVTRALRDLVARVSGEPAEAPRGGLFGRRARP